MTFYDKSWQHLDMIASSMVGHKAVLTNRCSETQYDWETK